MKADQAGRISAISAAHPAKIRLQDAGCLLTIGLLLLSACERQAGRVFDRNPGYAGKVDVHPHYPDAETLRWRVLTAQRDR